MPSCNWFKEILHLRGDERIGEPKSLVIIGLLLNVLNFDNFFGLNFSFHYDFPAGSSIVTVLGIIFILAAIVNIIKSIITKKQAA